MSAESIPHSAESRSVGERELRRDLHRPQVLALVVGAMVGSGIYIRPASIAQQLESPKLILAVWIIGGLLSLCGSLSYAQLAMRVPGTGGEYLFLRTTLGSLTAFLFGWMRLTVGPAVIAGMAVAFTIFLGDFVPLGGPWFHLALPWDQGRELLDIGPRQAIAVTTILGLAWINTRGVGRAGSFQLLVTVCKVIGLALLVIVITLFGHSSPAQTSIQAASTHPSTLAYGAALLGVMATYNGWANAAIVGGEVRDAERTLPWALITGMLIVIVLYVVTNMAYLNMLTLKEIASANSSAHPDAPSIASLAVQHAFGTRTATLLPIMFAISALGTAHCNVLVFPRIVLSMARDGLLPTSLAAVTPRSATPDRAIWASAAVAAVFALVGSYDRLTNLTTFGYNVFYALTTMGLLWSQRLAPPASRGRGYWSTTIIAILFLSGTGALITASVARGSPEVMTAVVLIASGLPIFALIQWLRSRGSPSSVTPSK